MADVTWVTAGIGGGKSMFAVRQACREFRHGSRMCVNNLPWEMEKLWEWCHERVDKPVDLNRRLRILTPDEVIEFYRYFPPMLGDIEAQLRERAKAMVKVTEEKRQEWFALAMKNVKAFETGKLPMEEITGHERPMLQLRQGDGGIFYQLDEVHLSFPARYWQEHGLAVEHYMSQLRKLNDDLMLITQHSGKVDKNFRRNGTEWIVLQNMSKVRLIGGVTLPGRFRYHSFGTEPQRNDKPTSSPWFNLNDEGYKDLYNTMSGVGLAGVLEKENSARKKGRHWSVWVVGVLIIGCIAYFVPTMMTKVAGYGLGHALNGFGEGVTKGVTGGKGLQTNQPPQTAFPSMTEALINNANQRAAEASASLVPQYNQAFEQGAAGQLYQPKEVETTCVGWSLINGNMIVMLSDGRTASSEFGEVQFVHRDYVRCYNELFKVSVAKIPPIPESYQLPSYETAFAPMPSVVERPVNQVTVIPFGESHRRETPKLNGFSQMNRNRP